MVCLISYVFLMCNIIFIGQSKEIVTTLGPIKGKFVDDIITGAKYYSFEGIPYAERPLKHLRFKPPIQKIPWTHVLDATKPGWVCPQIEYIHFKDEMNEDCLNFNIFTPANYSNKLFPVIVHIHTGDFKFASGKATPVYGPQFLILQDMVVVTMNYSQLGALGFLSLSTKEASGNAGIKDVLLVLKLVKLNIDKFGGDPNKITLAGFGAGAVIAQYLMMTNQSNGLFHNVILHSGSALSDKFTETNPRENALSLGNELGLKWTHDHSLIRKLRRVNAFELVNAEQALSRKDPQRGFRIFNPFRPTIEIENPTAIVTETPSNMIRNGAILNVPVCIGFNSQQGLEILLSLRKNQDLIAKLNKNFELCIPADIKYPYGSTKRRNLAMKIKKFYFDDEDISFDKFANYINLISDSQYTYHTDYLVKLLKEIKCSSVYYYVFDGDTELNWFKSLHNVTYPGAAHLDNLGYIFFTLVTKSRYQSIDVNTKHLQEILLKNTRNFMLYGDPSFNSTYRWPETGEDRRYITQGCNNIAIDHKPLPDRIGFWYSIYDEYFKDTEFKQI